MSSPLRCKPSDLEIGLPSVIDYILPGKIELAMNVPDGINRDELTSGYMIHHAAVDFGVSLINKLLTTTARAR
ncbi:hypothetical protein PR003_g24851 [Phytophthora rubi]|uniref:Uncharacterized protein n=1 Tax=Phytophthora rubi TaxID=129364 RepID=A0A6A4CPJ8_9STRA|nr:hypothetical protein PR003_g24851 [Phytophthora rubi]